VTRRGAPGEGVAVFGSGLLRSVGARARAAGLAAGECTVVADPAALRLHGAALLAGLRAAGWTPTVLAAPRGERGKTWDAAGRLLRSMAAAGARRGSPVFAFGGGVTTDLAGFAAAVRGRGTPWVAVPTTTLAMADAAFGGKTGVDLPEGKNLAGAFHFPVLVVCDADVLGTLPARHLRNGLVEAAKMEFLGGARRGLARLAALRRASADPGAAGRACARAARAKRAVVAEDPFEDAARGLRARLNLGHTFGHALEAAAGWGPVLHGEAVAAGLVAACAVAEARGLLPRGRASEVRDALAAALVPRLGRGLARGVGPAALLRYAGADKKRDAGGLRMVLPREEDPPVIVGVSAGETRLAAEVVANL
jgi:3-dehydroquinate synthetase